MPKLKQTVSLTEVQSYEYTQRPKGKAAHHARRKWVRCSFSLLTQSDFFSYLFLKNGDSWLPVENMAADPNGVQVDYPSDFPL